MKTNTIIAILLIIVGATAFIYQGITYTYRQKAFDLGSIHVTTEQTKTIPLPPILGGIAFIGGIVMLIARSNKTNNS